MHNTISWTGLQWLNLFENSFLIDLQFMYPLKKFFFLQCNCSLAAFLCLNHLLIFFFSLKKEIIRKSVMCAKLTDILEQAYSKSYHRFNWHFLMTCSSKSAWKQIESWLSLLFKTTLCCVWLFKRYADYFCAWHYVLY